MRIAHHFSISTVAFLIGLGSAPALAQTAANDTHVTAEPGWSAQNGDTLQSSAIDQMVDRSLNQETQIGQGLKSGELTDSEAARLERGESRIDNMEASALSNEQASAQEVARIRNAQNTESGRIYALENNGVTGAPASSSDNMAADVQRNVNQQKRIDQGIDSGSLTAAEAGDLEKSQASVDAAEAKAARNNNVTANEQQGIQADENAQSSDIYNDKHNGTVASGGSTNPPSDLTQDGQALQAAHTQLERAQQTEHQDFQQLRTDELAGNATAVQQDRANLIAQQQIVQTDRQTVEGDATASHQALQPEIQAVQQDKSTLRTDLQQTRTDRQDGNTTALQQDLTNDQTARQNLQTADTTLQQDRTAVDLNNRSASDREDTHDHDRFASNGPEASMTADNVSSGQVVAGETGTTNGSVSGQATTSTNIGGTGGTNAWNGQTINTPPAVTGGEPSTVNVGASNMGTGGATTTTAAPSVSAPVAAPVAAPVVTPPHVAAAPHIVPHHH